MALGIFDLDSIADLRLEFMDSRPKHFPPFFAFGGLNKSDRRRCCCCGGRNGRGAENETAGAIHKEINQRPRSANESAACTQRLAERAHLDFNPVADAKLFRKSAAVFPVKPGGVRFIHHEPRAVFFLERGDFAQRRGVAVH